MNNANLSRSMMRFVKPSFFALLFASLLTAAPAQAAGDKPNENPVEIKYLGSTEGKPTFEISVSNTSGEAVDLTLRDENGTLIYSDNFKGASYTRKLQFADLDTDKLKLTLTLRTKKDTQMQSFEISKRTRIIEDVAVVSL